MLGGLYSLVQDLCLSTECVFSGLQFACSLNKLREFSNLFQFYD